MWIRARGIGSRLLRAALRHPRAASLTAIGFLLLSVSQLALTWLVKLWIDGPLSHDSTSTVPLLLPATAILVCVLSAAVFVAHYGLGSLHTAVIRDLRAALQAHLLRLEVAAMESNAGGDLVARLLQDADVAGRFAGEILRRGLGDALVFVGALTMLLVIDRQLFGLIVLIAPLGVMGHSLVAVAIRKRSLTAQRRLGALSARFSEQVSGHRTIKGYRTESIERQRFDVENQAHAEALRGVERWSAFALASIWLVTGSALLGVGLYAGYALGAGRLAAGDFLIFCLFGAQMVEPVRRLGELSTLAQRSLAAGQRVYEVLDRRELERTDGKPLPQPVGGAVRFEAVRLAYSPERPVLTEVTFQVAGRETVAIVSPSGGGKSTIAGLLVRFFNPGAGVIRLDGHDLSALRIADVRRWVKVVAQDPFLFSGTVLENIRYGANDASATVIDEAVQRAGLETWLRSLPSGLDTSLDEAGRNLSGGQKQRIALARAIVAQPAVLVLDEATSAVDSDTEEHIMTRLASWLQERTVILMAHRLSTVLRVPRALVLDGGRIVEDGAPLDLLRRSSRFARIFGDQLGAGKGSQS